MTASFEVQIGNWVAKAKGAEDAALRKLALQMFRRVIQKSPVLTGRFKGNWQAAIGSIPEGTLDTLDKNGTATNARVQATVLGAKAGDVIYLVNNLAYARRLEYGHSKQTPAGMVRTTVEEFGAVVRQTVGEVSK